MAAEDESVETKVSDQGSVTIPTSLRQRLGIEPGDKLRWTTDDTGNLSVEVIQQREGVFDDFEPVDAGKTDAIEAEREFGSK
jgi:AbrB family looped-hinge helix DNA binding protein